MSEMPPDISYVKFVRDPEIMTPVVNEATQGVWARYEVVNIGTAPTTGADVVSLAVCFSGTVIHDQEHALDNPVLDANGGSYQGTVHFGLDDLRFPGEWEMVIQVNRPGSGQGISDVAHLPFTVEGAASSG
jgi:hypothetical protein